MAPSDELEYRGTVNAPMAPVGGIATGGAPIIGFLARSTSIFFDLKYELTEAQLVRQVGSPLDNELLVIPLIENPITTKSPLDDRRRQLCQSRAVAALEALWIPHPSQIGVVGFL